MKKQLLEMGKEVFEDAELGGNFSMITGMVGNNFQISCYGKGGCWQGLKGRTKILISTQNLKRSKKTKNSLRNSSKFQQVVIFYNATPFSRNLGLISRKDCGNKRSMSNFR